MSGAFLARWNTVEAPSKGPHMRPEATLPCAAVTLSLPLRERAHTALCRDQRPVRLAQAGPSAPGLKLQHPQAAFVKLTCDCPRRVLLGARLTQTAAELQLGLKAGIRSARGVSPPQALPSEHGRYAATSSQIQPCTCKS